MSATSLTDEEKKLIAIELGRLTLVRQEDASDYNFELWIDYFEDSGMLFPEIMQAIKSARELKKYGGTLLAVGDVVDNYKDSTKDENISWTGFLKKLNEYERRAYSDINSLVGQHIPLATYFKHRLAIEASIEDKYLKPSADLVLKSERRQWLGWLEDLYELREPQATILKKIEELRKELSNE